MALLFWFRKSNKDPNRGSIQMRVTHQKEREEIGSTHIECYRHQWNQDKQHFSEKSLWAAEQNSKLNALSDRMSQLETRLEAAGYEISATFLKQCFLGEGSADPGLTGITHRRTQYTLGKLFELHLAHQQRRLDIGRLAPATIVVQTNYAANINDYLTLIAKAKHPATTLRAAFMEDLEYHLKIKESFSDAHIEKHLKFIKQVLRFAAAPDRQLIKANPLADYVIDGVMAQPDTTHLTVEQLDRLISYDFMELYRTRKLSRATAVTLGFERDAFVFNCFTGMHHGDYTDMNYRIELERGEYWLMGRREKTDRDFTLKLLAPAVELYKKYGEVITNVPTKSNQRRNDSLKLIAAHVELPLNLSTKIARKTFADITLNEMLIPADDVAAMLGLAATKRLLHYVRPRRRRLSALMTSWDTLRASVA